MNAQDNVERQLQQEFEKFNNAVYSGKVTLPINILELFKIGIMGMPSQFHRIQGSRLRAIGGKQLDEITNGEVSDLIKIIVNTPLERMYDDFEEAVQSIIRFDKFILSFNGMVDEFKGQLEMKRKTLMDLSGLNGGASIRQIIR